MIIAIDPGTGGGFAWSDGNSFQTMKMPKKKMIRNDAIMRTKKGNPKYEVDEDMILQFLDKKKTLHNDLVIVIEHQQLRIGDSEGFKQFRVQALLNNYNTIKSFGKALDIKIETIQARMWQKKFKPLPRDYTKKKAALLKIAKGRYARLKPTAATCDAILILEHALIQKSYE